MLSPIIKRIGIFYGIIGAVLMVANYLLFWYFDHFTSPFINVLSWVVIPLLFGFAAQAHSKLKLGGYIDTREAVGAFFITILIILVTESMTLKVLYSYIDPSLIDQMHQVAMDMYERAKSTNPNAFEPQRPDLSFSGYAMSTVLKILFTLVPGIIVGLILRKKRPTPQTSKDE